jgi:outer membrane receptor for ferrienterochelin and colicin
MHGLPTSIKGGRMGRLIKAIGACCFWVLVFLVAVSSPGWAQAPSAQAPAANPSPEESLFMDIPQVVTSASFFKQSTKEAPGTTYIVTAAQIDMGAVGSMADVLQDFVPGMYTTAHGFLGTLIGSRGITTDTSSKTEYMIDGMNVNSHWNSGAAPETAMPFLGDIAKVEIIMGPGAIVHGSGAINGFINVIPQKRDRLSRLDCGDQIWVCRAFKRDPDGLR